MLLDGRSSRPLLDLIGLNQHTHMQFVVRRALPLNGHPSRPLPPTPRFDWLKSAFPPQFVVTLLLGAAATHPSE